MDPKVKPRCSKRVADGGRSVAFHTCANNAVEGTDPPLCGTHRAQAERRKAGPPEPRPATGQPVEVRVSTTLSIAMEWKPDEGPVFPKPYGTQPIQWMALSVKFAADGRPVSVGGYGTVMRADGTPGERSARMDGYGDFDRIPGDVQRLFLTRRDAWLEED